MVFGLIVGWLVPAGRRWWSRSTTRCSAGRCGRSPAEDEAGHAEGCEHLAAAVDWLAQGDWHLEASVSASSRTINHCHSLSPVFPHVRP
jgi:hypothetical protein